MDTSINYYVVTLIIRGADNMKKLITGVCCAAMLFANMTFASDDSQIKVYLDNEKVSYDVGPVVTDKGPMIPLRLHLRVWGE